MSLSLTSGRDDFLFWTNHCRTPLGLPFMNRTAVMTLGFLLLFTGIQLNFVDSYVLTPRVANFLSEQLPARPVASPGTAPAISPGGAINPQAPQYSQVGFTPYDVNVNVNARPQLLPQAVNRVIRPPSWLGWPVMFLGAVFFLNGLAIRQ